MDAHRIDSATLAALDKSVADALNRSRLQRFAAPLLALGVREARDLTEVSEDDLKAVAMSDLQRRRFQAALNRMPQTTAASVPSPSAKVQPSRALADMDPAVIEWIEARRLASFATGFATLGVEELADFAEVTREDLRVLGLSELQCRRFVTNRQQGAEKVVGSPTHTPGPAAKAMVQTSNKGAGGVSSSSSTSAASGRPASLPQAGSRAYFEQFGFDVTKGATKGAGGAASAPRGT